jgi:nucleoside phosphorylase
MAYRTPSDVKKQFRDYPRRALIITTVVHESRAVKAHLAGLETLIGEKGAFYEYGRFFEPAGEWLVVHAITPQGNSDVGLVATNAHQDFGKFHVQIFIGVAGSLKQDIPIGSIVIGDYVYNGHSAKVEDTETLGRPQGLIADRELLIAAQALIYSDEWKDLLRAPAGMELPDSAHYPCDFPPLAVIKGIVSGEEVVAGGKSPRYAWLRSHFNNCGAVEMEGWGAMNAARYESTPAIIVRGISDMCAGKDHATDKLHQPVAAAHAAAFAFGILSFRSKIPPRNAPVVDDQTTRPAQPPPREAEISPQSEERRIDFVLNFKGSKDQWTEEKVHTIVEHLKQVIADDDLTLIRVEAGSVRLVVSIRETAIARIDLAKLREDTAKAGGTLLGAMPLEGLRALETAKKALLRASANLLAWDKTLPAGGWIERPERESIEARFQLDTSSTVLIGDPGSGKSALLSKISSDLVARRASIFALKSDLLSPEVGSEADLQRELSLPAPPGDLILSVAVLEPVYVIIDQLDALAAQLDLRGGRLNALLNLIRRIGGERNIHVLLSARSFEFNHDVRLRAVEAESITLSLPPWHEVKEQLTDIGINSDSWPEKARDVVRIPQALKTFIALASAGRTEPFTTYQAMLEQLWSERIASAEDGDRLAALASDLAGKMAEEEALWLAAARFDDRVNALQRLEALGFVVRSENHLSIAFSHQTVFDYILARTFVRNVGLLSTYVLERQDSLFVRAKVWSALNYLRQAEVNSYARELLEIWNTKELRRHLRLLLIGFLGQVRQPLDFEVTCMAAVLNSGELRQFGLNAIAGSSGWFAHFASGAIREAMSGSELETRLALRILSCNWHENAGRVIRLIKESWLPQPQRDNYSWMAIHECPKWTDEVEEIARSVLHRTAISIWQVDFTAQTVAVDYPEAAIRLVRAKLDFTLAAAKSLPESPPFPLNGTEDEKASWFLEHRQTKRFESLLDSADWTGLPSLAEVAPAAFLEYLWSWYVAAFEEIVSRMQDAGIRYSYPGQYVLEFDLKPTAARRHLREQPLMSALQIAVRKLATDSPDAFSKWADGNSHFAVLAVQQLIAHGYEVAAGKLASRALAWLLLDPRRFQLGTPYGHRQTTTDLVRACAPHWTTEEIRSLEKAVIGYRPPAPKHIKEPEQRKRFADLVRASKKELLEAIGSDRLAPENRELVDTERRALGTRFERSMGDIQGGWIGSPMDAAAMAKAKDRDILNIFRQIPDDTSWDHPRDWMRGGNIQLSRAFAEFARTSPERAIRVMEQFEPNHQERAAGYALDAMADDVQNDSCVIDAFLDLRSRGFHAEEFGDSAARAIDKVVSRKAAVSDEVVTTLVEWLRLTRSSDKDTAVEEMEFSPGSNEEGLKEGSILWGLGTASALPNGNFNILSALGSILLNRKESGRDLYLEILDDHLSRERDPNVWKALLFKLGNAGGASPQVVSNFVRKLFGRFPAILPTRETVVFLAYAQRWDDQLVLDLVRDWNKSGQAFLQRAYGELVGLVAIVKQQADWVRAQDAVIASGTNDMKIGLAYAGVHLWSDPNLRLRSTETLVAVLKGAGKEVVAAVMDLFRVADELVCDKATVKLLRAMADPATDMSAAPSHFVVERLQALLPHEANLVAAIAAKLVAGWRDKLSDMRTTTVSAAPQLTDLALTLHRLGGASRQAGIDLFEALIEIDAYRTRETLAEIDGRFGPAQVPARPRLGRRRREHNQH